MVEVKEGQLGQSGLTGNQPVNIRRLPAPTGLVAEDGTGHVLLNWEEVKGAFGYLVLRSTSSEGPFRRISQSGTDVQAVPAPPYADTLAEPNVRYWYKVATWANDGRGELTAEPVSGCPQEAPEGQLASTQVSVDASAAPISFPRVWQRMMGAEHFSMLVWDTVGPGGSNVAEEFAESLSIVHDELGVRTVRAHGTFLPEMVTENADGSFDFSGLDDVYDRLLDIGVKPVVELSFMPRELAADPEQTIFQYKGITSPPRDWSRWGDLCRDLTVHLRDRYGADEVAGWEFEVWNEPNIRGFWTGKKSDYLRLYEVSAKAVKGVDERIRVGGPGSAQAKWIGLLLDHCRENGVPIDFVSTHTYGQAPLNLRSETRLFAAETGRREPEILWTEWGVTHIHRDPVNDTPFVAPFFLRGMKSALESTDCLSYWVASDHFEEEGHPERLFHHGFGMLTVGNLRKPQFWAAHLLSRMVGGRVPASVTGDGAEALVEALATRSDNGSTIDVLTWNGTLDKTKIDGAPVLDRTVDVVIHGLEVGAAYEVHSWRVDQDHGNIKSVWEDMGGGDWPDELQWEELRDADRLPAEVLSRASADAGGDVTIRLTLPNPGVRALRLTRL